MDAAKTINLLACQDIPMDKLYDGQYSDEILPMILCRLQREQDQK